MKEKWQKGGVGIKRNKVSSDGKKTPRWRPQKLLYGLLWLLATKTLNPPKSFLEVDFGSGDVVRACGVVAF